MFRFRRLAAIVLEDFGLRRPTPAPEPAIVAPPLAPPPPPANELSGVLAHGSARRRPELERFCEHLERTRALESARVRA